MRLKMKNKSHRCDINRARSKNVATATLSCPNISKLKRNVCNGTVIRV